MRRAITVGAGLVLAVTIAAAATSSGASPITASRSQVTSGWSSARDIDAHGLVSISCPETSFCAAVDSAGQTMTYDRGSWSKPARPAGGHVAVDVSCASQRFCVAVDGDEGGEGTGAYTTFTGKAWSEWYPMSVGPGLSSISCPAADFCAGSSYLGVQTFDGLRWSSISQFPLVVSVSCSSAKFCMAVGTQAPFAYPVLYHGSSWVRESGTSLVGDPATVSCVGPTRCVELGYGVAIGAPNPEFVNTYNGTSWSRYSSFRLVGLEGMSCAGPSFCMALVGHGAYELADGSWKVSPLDDPSGVPQSISCATASFCITVDSKGRAFLYS